MKTMILDLREETPHLPASMVCDRKDQQPKYAYGLGILMLIIALVKSSKYSKESESKLREGREVQREAHLLDKTSVLIASLMGKKQRMLRKIESGKALIRSSSKIGACLLRLVQ